MMSQHHDANQAFHSIFDSMDCNRYVLPDRWLHILRNYLIKAIKQLVYVGDK